MSSRPHICSVGCIPVGATNSYEPPTAQREQVLPNQDRYLIIQCSVMLSSQLVSLQIGTKISNFSTLNTQCFYNTHTVEKLLQSMQESFVLLVADIVEHLNID